MNIDARFFALAVFGIALLTGMDALAKALAGGYGTFQIVFFRYAVSLLLFAAAIPLLRPYGRAASGCVRTRRARC